LTYRHPFSSKKDVCQSRIYHFGYACLLSEVERHIPHISLHLAEREGKLVVMFIRYSVVRAELDEVMGLERNEVGENIAPRKCKVLNN